MPLSSSPTITCWDQTPDAWPNSPPGRRGYYPRPSRVRFFVGKPYTSLTHLHKTLHKISLTRRLLCSIIFLRLSRPTQNRLSPGVPVRVGPGAPFLYSDRPPGRALSVNNLFIFPL